MLGLDLAKFLCLPFKIVDEGHPLPQGREMHRGDRRRAHRPGVVQVQPDRPRPAAGPGRACSSAPTSARPRCRSKITSSRPIARRSPASPARPEALRASFSHLVLKEDLFNAIGPAIISRPSRVHLRPAGQRQDGHGPVDRRLHEHGRRVDLRPVRHSGRRRHHHRLRPVAAPDRRRPTGGDDDSRRPRPGAAQHRHRSTPAGSASAGRSSSPAAN